MRRLHTLFLGMLLLLAACEQAIIPEPEPPTPPSEDITYFPPINSDSWQSLSPDSLGWDATALTELYQFLETNNSRAFLILKDGKVVVEKYWGNNIANTAAFTRNSQWYWASAGKTLTAFLVGIAQEKALLNIEEPSASYLGEGWTSLSSDKENQIAVRHQLTMTTGLDYEVDNLDCTDPQCLQYKADAGTQWFYHNAPYTLLEQVVSNASGQSYNDFTHEELESKIGMSGNWLKNNFNNVYWSKPRDAARFGWLILNEGSWDGEQIMKDSTYFQAMVNTSQSLNPSYGYLWWLNGKEGLVLPGLPTLFPISLAPNAPVDLFAAMGKNGQFIDLLPSQNLVVVRMGEAPDGSLVPVKFHDEMWERLVPIIED